MLKREGFHKNIPEKIKQNIFNNLAKNVCFPPMIGYV